MHISNSTTLKLATLQSNSYSVSFPQKPPALIVGQALLSEGVVALSARVQRADEAQFDGLLVVVGNAEVILETVLLSNTLFSNIL